MAQQKPKKPQKPRNYSTSGSSRSTSKSAKAKTGRPKASATKTSKATASKASASKSGRKKPAPNMQERMEGLQGWMAEIERKQGRMTYFGGAAALIAVAASAGALYLGVTNKNDAATKDDVDAIQEQVDGIKAEVKRTVEKELKTTNDRIATLEQSVDDLKKKQAQDAEDIAALQNRSNTGGGGSGAQLGAGTGGSTNSTK